MQEKTAKMEVKGQKINHHMEELQTEATRPQEETKEHVEEIERNARTVQEKEAQKLNTGRLEENLDGPEQNLRERVQSGVAGLSNIFCPLSTQGLNSWKSTSHLREGKIWGKKFSKLRRNSLRRFK